MMKYDCSKTLDYDHEVNRMCKTIPTSPIGKCPNCPLANIGGCSPASGLIQKTIDIVQKWSDEHPEQPKLTREEDSFICSFKVTANKYIERKQGYLFLTMGYNSIDLWPTMFSFIEEGEMWALDDLLKLEVEE